jgi:hypothetical protein
MPPTSLPLVGSGPFGDDWIEACGDPERAGKRVLLICAPYHLLSMSSLSTAHLGTFLRERGVHCVEAYLHFEFARLVGTEVYRQLSDGVDGLSGELLFAEGLWGELPSPEAQQRLAKYFGPAEQRISSLRELEDRCLTRLCQEQPDIVGLSTSCHQLLPALWFARVLKRYSPTIKTVLGGSACAEPMGERILEAYPDVDWVVSGYGEVVVSRAAPGPRVEPAVCHPRRRDPGLRRADRADRQDPALPTAPAGEPDSHRSLQRLLSALP